MTSISPNYDDYLMHHGVKGMKWGVRKKQEKSRSSSETILERRKTRVPGDYAYKIKNNKGKKVGNLYLTKTDNNELNLNWMNVKKKYRGQGHASNVVEQIDKIAKEMKVDKITAEVVGASPDMMHIMKKYGYIKVGNITDKHNQEIWDGLTLVEKTMNKRRK